MIRTACQAATDDERALVAHLDIVAKMQRMAHPDVLDGFVSHCVESFVLERGRFFDPPQTLRFGFKMMKPQRCFYNAYVLAREKSVTYVEGFAVGVIPVHHAWVVTKDGDVVDPTWAGRRMGGYGAAYLGIPFDVRQVERSIELSGCVLFDWRNDYQALRGRYDANGANSVDDRGDGGNGDACLGKG